MESLHLRADKADFRDLLIKFASHKGKDSAGQRCLKDRLRVGRRIRGAIRRDDAMNLSSGYAP